MTTGRGPAVDVDAAHALTLPLWRGVARVTLTTKQYRLVRTAYPTTYLHMRAGVGCHLKHQAAGAGLYEVWLEPRKVSHG